MERRFQRIPLEFPATLIHANGECPVRVEDISLRGVLVEGTQIPVLESGAVVTLDIPLSDEARIAFEGRVRWQEGLWLGLEIEAMPLESATHLRRLVELNLGDEALLEREFAAMAESVPTRE
ncbi:MULTISPECIES: PilZ domain-containing protein [unclassified Thioalkalivibrio]|uniref:PilZ domain-containing protein n=1 Tax=unclassified Thioalkalivibrio TaxID=2621013 RepID=UPI00036B6C37|nr:MULTISPECIES: PilZ domain-containing protein [unclassified Thioalkalivibrio]